MQIIFLFLISSAFSKVTSEVIKKLDKGGKLYTPDWEDLDFRPLPQWYDEAKVGIFIHWGVYCVPSLGSEWFWRYWRNKSRVYTKFMKDNYPPGFVYQDFAKSFKAEFFDPNSWAKLFLKSGAKYVILTSKHHDGFSLYPSNQSLGWNSVEVGPKKDIVFALSKAVRKQGLKYGLYNSLYEWYNPMYIKDAKNNFTTSHYVTKKLLPDLKQIVRDYKPSVIWSDGHWRANDSYWKSKEFIAWLYNESPVKNQVVVNDRWGRGLGGKHGDFYNYADRFNNRILQSHKWENAFTLDTKSWGYRQKMSLNQVLTTSDLLSQLITTVSCGGNVLINVGPTKEGTIAPIFQERLLSLGQWLGINGEAIYKSSPWLSQNDTSNGKVWYTCTKTKYNALQPTAIPTSDDTVTAIYAITLGWPRGNVLKLQDVSSYLQSGNYKVTLLGNKGTYLNWTIADGLAHIQLPDKSTVKSENAWTLKFTMK